MTNNSVKDEDLLIKRMTRWNSYQREDENWKWKGRPNHRNLTVKAALNNDKLKQKVHNDSISMKEVERNLEILANFIRDNADPRDSENESSVDSHHSTDSIKCNCNEASSKIKAPITKVKKYDSLKLTDCLKIKKDLRNKFSRKKDEKPLSIDMKALDLLEIVNNGKNDDGLPPSDSSKVEFSMSPKSRLSVVIVDDSVQLSTGKSLSMIDKVKLHNTFRLKAIQQQHLQHMMIPNINSNELIDFNTNNRFVLSTSPITFNDKTMTTNTEKIENNDTDNDNLQIGKIDASRFEYLKSKYLNNYVEHINIDGLGKAKKKSTKRKKEKSLETLMIQAQDDSNLGYPYNFYANNSFEIDRGTSIKLPAPSEQRKVYTPSNKVEVRARPVSSPSLPRIKKGIKDITNASVKSILVNKSKNSKTSEMNKNKDSLMSNNQIKHKSIVTDINYKVGTNNTVVDNIDANIEFSLDYLSPNLPLTISSDMKGVNNFDTSTLISNECNSNSLSPGGSSIFYISDSEDDMSTVVDVGSFSNSVNLNYKIEDFDINHVQQNVTSSDTSCISIEVLKIAVNSPNTKNTYINSKSIINGDVNSPNTKNTVTNSNPIVNGVVNSPNTKNTVINSNPIINGGMNSPNTKNTVINSNPIVNGVVNSPNTKNTVINSKSIINGGMSSPNTKNTVTNSNPIVNGVVNSPNTKNTVISSNPIINGGMSSPNTKNTVIKSNPIVNVNSPTAYHQPIIDFADNIVREKSESNLSNFAELKVAGSEISHFITSEHNNNMSPNTNYISNNNNVEAKAQVFPSSLYSSQPCIDYSYRKNITASVIPNQQNVPAKLSSSNNLSFITPTSTRFFDVSSTSDKGRFRVNDAREFDTDSLFRRPDILNNFVTVLFGKKRSTGETKVISLLFDRDEFKSELDAYNWWLNNKDRFNV